MKARCPVCGKISLLLDSDAGLAVICVACGSKFDAPRLESSVAPIGSREVVAASSDHHADRVKKSGLILGVWAVIGVGLLLALVIWAVVSMPHPFAAATADSVRAAKASPLPPGASRSGLASRPTPASRPTTSLVRSSPPPLAVSANKGGAHTVERATTRPAPVGVAASPSVAILGPPVIRRPPARPQTLASADPTDAQIGEAIKKGVDYLLAQFSASTSLLRDLDTGPRDMTTGEDVLCVYALLQAGQAIDDLRLNPKESRMKGMILAMNRLPLAQYHWETYSRALRATALGILDRPDDRQTLAADVMSLVRGAREGAYTYRVTPSRGVPRDPTIWDNSNSQYGLLGVWSGAEVGREVPRAYWEAISKHWEMNQDADGEWSYHAPDRFGAHSMTCAGLASLFVAHDYLEPARFTGAVGRDPFIPAIVRGLRWLETGANSVTLDHAGYDLYGLERVGLASGFKYFGAHDWYRELAADTIKAQQPDGSWGGISGTYGRRVETAYSLLFLSRGRHPILMNKLSFGGYWANRPRDVANLARFASKQLERPLNWQVVPLAREWTDWTDSPILYLASHQAVKFSDEDCAKIRSFVENGGLFFTQADGDSSEFNRSAEELAGRLFAPYKMVELPANHPVFNAMFPIAPVTGLRAVSNGSRLLMVHSTTDLAKSLELRDDKHKPVPFEVETNLFLYAAGKRDLRNRLVSTYIPPLATAPVAKFRVARLRYEGNWDPEPAAWERFGRWFQGETGYGLELDSVPIANLRPGTAPIAVLTGTARYELSGAEAGAIKKYVEAGGVLLVDVCGGTGDFDAGLESSLYFNAFADKSSRTLSSSHPILSGQASGMEDLTRPRLRASAVEAIGSGGGFPEELGAGAGHVILTRLDFTTGLLGTQTWGIRGYDPDYAMRLVKNVILWTLDGQHDQN